MNSNDENEVYFDDHPIFSQLQTNLQSNGLKFRKDVNKPIEDNETFKKLGLFVDKLINDRNLPLRRKDLRGSYSWQFSNLQRSGETLMKLNHYDENDYFWGIREDWLELNRIWDEVKNLCTYRFAVPPKVQVKFLGLPCKKSPDLDRIKEIIDLIPSNPEI